LHIDNVWILFSGNTKKFGSENKIQTKGNFDIFLGHVRKHQGGKSNTPYIILIGPQNMLVCDILVAEGGVLRSYPLTVWYYLFFRRTICMTYVQI